MREFWALIIAETSKLASTFIRTRPLRRGKPAEEIPAPSITEVVPGLSVRIEDVTPKLEAPKRQRKAQIKEAQNVIASPSKTSPGQSEADYRFECL